MLQHVLFSMSSRGPTSHLSFSLCTGYQLLLAYRSTTGSAPSYIHSLLWVCIPSRIPWLANAITERHKINFQNIFVPSSLLVERSPRLHLERRIPDNIQKTAENSSLSWAHNLISLKKKKKKILCFHFPFKGLVHFQMKVTPLTLKPS